MNLLQLTYNENSYKSNLLLFSASRIISELGSAIFKFALSLYILDISGSSIIFSMIMGFAYLPGILVNTFAGIYIDKHDKKKILILFDFLSGLLTILFFILFLSMPESVTLITVFQIIISATVAMFTLSLTSSIPNLSNEKNIPQFNSISMGITAIVNIGGPILGACLYKAVGINVIVIFDAISFFISMILELFLRYNKYVIQQTSESYIDSFKKVWGYLNKQVILKYMLISITLVNFILSPLVTLVFQYINYHELEVSAFQLSLIQSFWFIGIILAAIISSAIKPIYTFLKRWFDFMKIQSIFIILWAIFKLPIFSGETEFNKWIITIVFSLLLLIVAIFNGFTSIPAISFIQIDTPENIRASIIGVVNTACQAAVPIGMWVYGILLANMDWSYVVVIPAVLLFIFSAIADKKSNVKGYFSNMTNEYLSNNK